jgi:hypothetical protein
MRAGLKYVPVGPHDRVTLLYCLAREDPEEVAETLGGALGHDECGGFFQAATGPWPPLGE